MRTGAPHLTSPNTEATAHPLRPRATGRTYGFVVSTPLPTVSTPGTLDGLRVLDLSQAIAGPFAGRILADLGADVVRVEWENGDVTNRFGPPTAGLTGRVHPHERRQAGHRRRPQVAGRRRPAASPRRPRRRRAGQLPSRRAGPRRARRRHPAGRQPGADHGVGVGLRRHQPGVAARRLRPGAARRDAACSPAWRRSTAGRSPTSPCRWPTRWPRCTRRSPCSPRCTCATAPASVSTST